MGNYFYYNTAVESTVSEEFKKYGANDRNTYIDTSFTKLADMNITKLKRVLSADTTLYIGSVSHLGKTKREVKNQIEWLIDNDVPFVILNIPSTLSKESRKEANRLIHEAVINEAKVEISNQKKAQRVGIDKARKQGKQLGRSRISYPDNWEELYCMWLNKDITTTEFMKKTGLKKTSFYSLLKKYSIDNKVFTDKNRDLIN